MLSFYLKTIFVILSLHVLCGCNSQSDNSANTTSAYTAPSSKDQDLNTDETVSPTDQVSALQTALQQAELNQMRLQEQLYEQEWNISQLQDALQGTQNSANPQRQEEWEQLLLELEVLHLRGNNREQQTERQRELAKYKRQEEELGHLRRQVLSLQQHNTEQAKQNDNITQENAILKKNNEEITVKHKATLTDNDHLSRELLRIHQEKNLYEKENNFYKDKITYAEFIKEHADALHNLLNSFFGNDSNDFFIFKKENYTEEGLDVFRKFIASYEHERTTEREEFEAYKNYVNACTASIKSNTEEIEEYKEKFNNVKSDLSRFEAEFKNEKKLFQSAIIEKENNIKALELDILEKENNIKALELDILEKENNIKALELDILEKENTIKDLALANFNKCKNLNEILKKERNIDNILKGMEEYYDVQISSLNKQISILNEYVSAKDKEIKNLEESENTMNNLLGGKDGVIQLKNRKLKEKQNKITSLTAELNQIKDVLKDFFRTDKEKNISINDIKNNINDIGLKVTQVEKLTGEKEKLKENISNLERENGELKNNILPLKPLHEKLKDKTLDQGESNIIVQEFNKNEKKIKLLEEKNNDLNKKLGDFEGYKSEVKILRDKNNELEKSLHSKNQNITELNSKIEILKSDDRVGRFISELKGVQTSITQLKDKISPQIYNQNTEADIAQANNQDGDEDAPKLDPINAELCQIVIDIIACTAASIPILLGDNNAQNYESDAQEQLRKKIPDILSKQNNFFQGLNTRKLQKQSSRKNC